MRAVKVRLVHVASDIGRCVEISSRRGDISVPHLYHAEIIVGQSVSVVIRDGQSQTFFGHYHITQCLQYAFVLCVILYFITLF